MICVNFYISYLRNVRGRRKRSNANCFQSCVGSHKPWRDPGFQGSTGRARVWETCSGEEDTGRPSVSWDKSLEKKGASQ